MEIISVSLDNSDMLKKIIDLIYKTFCECNRKDSSEKLIKKYDELFGPNMVYENTINHFSKTSEIFFVAMENGELLGFIRGTRDKIINIYIDPQFQGKGIGKFLMEGFEKKAKELGSKKIILKPSKYAYDFYLKNGYKQEDKKYLVKHL